MAADSKIERYLAELDHQLQHRRDRADLVDEVGDHLYSAAERWRSSGAGDAEAETRALAQFGRSDLVAALMRVSPAQATNGARFLARRVGLFCAGAAAAWIAATAVFFYGLVEYRGFYWEDGWYWVASATVAIAFVATAVALLAINVRTTGELEDVGLGVVLIGIVAAFMCLMMLWLAPVWLAILAFVTVWTLARAWRSPAGSRFGTVAMAGVLSAAGVYFLVIWVVSYFVPGGISEPALVVTPVFLTFAVLAVGFTDIAVRSAYRSSSARPIAA